jgi:hypothetical protein
LTLKIFLSLSSLRRSILERVLRRIQGVCRKLADYRICGLEIGHLCEAAVRVRDSRAPVVRQFGAISLAWLGGPRFFEELMTAVGSEDGREIVLKLEELGRHGRLRRDSQEGRKA